MGLESNSSQPEATVRHPKLAIGDIYQPPALTQEGWSRANPEPLTKSAQAATTEPHHSIRINPNAIITFDGKMAAPALTLEDKAQPKAGEAQPKAGEAQPKAGEVSPKANDAARPLPQADTTPGHKFSLEPVTDPKITKQVPGAMYIGVRGSIRAMENHKPVIQDGQRLWLSPEAARGLQKAQDILDAQGKGKEIQLTNLNAAGRLHDAQLAIQLAQPNQPHARPGRSNHEVGKALDIANYGDKDVMAALRKAGFRQGDSHGPIKNDLVHFSYHGGDGGTTGRTHQSAHSGGREHSPVHHHSRRRHRH